MTTPAPSRSGVPPPDRLGVPLPDRPGLRLAGSDVLSPLVTGELRPYVNFDYAASAPPLQAVVDALAVVTPWYSSVHRGAGFKSQVSTAAYEGARAVVREFVRAGPEHEVIFTRNTTDSVNLLASALPEGTRVITFLTEHHANMLPWRRTEVTHLPVPPSPEALLEALRAELQRVATPGGVLVAVTGASNVTGERWPLAEIGALAHAHGARVFVDAAQLAPHGAIDMAGMELDYLALSGHKLYAPYGAGVLVGRPDWLEGRAPFLQGGGAVQFVTADAVSWAPLPDRQEAGSPNVLGAVAIGVAMRELLTYGLPRIAAAEERLQHLLRERLLAIPGLEWYTAWAPDHPRVGLMTFNLRGLDYGLVAAILSAEYGIGVRHGCFCAHPLLLHLMHVSGADADQIRAEMGRGDRRRVPGAVRVSLGLGSAADDIEYLAEALGRIVAKGPNWTYRRSSISGDYEPDPDPRSWPDLGIQLAGHGSTALGESS